MYINNVEEAYLEALEESCCLKLNAQQYKLLWNIFDEKEINPYDENYRSDVYIENGKKYFECFIC